MEASGPANVLNVLVQRHILIKNTSLAPAAFEYFPYQMKKSASSHLFVLLCTKKSHNVHSAMLFLLDVPSATTLTAVELPRVSQWQWTVHQQRPLGEHLSEWYNPSGPGHLSPLAAFFFISTTDVLLFSTATVMMLTSLFFQTSASDVLELQRCSDAGAAGSWGAKQTWAT